MQTANNPLFRPFYPLTMPFPRPGESALGVPGPALHPAFLPPPAQHLFPAALPGLRPPPHLFPAPSQSSLKSAKSFTIDAILGGRAGQQAGTTPGYCQPPDMGLPGGGGEGGLLSPGLAAQCPRSLRYGRAHPLSITKGVGDRKSPHGSGALSPSAWKHSKSKRVRTIFTPEQLERLEAEFERQQYMVGTERYYLAASLNLTEAQVKVWFQNRRIKWRKQNLEQQHAKLANMELYSGEEASESDVEEDAQSHGSRECNELTPDQQRDILDDEEIAVDFSRSSSGSNVHFIAPELNHTAESFGEHGSLQNHNKLVQLDSPGIQFISN